MPQVKDIVVKNKKVYLFKLCFKVEEESTMQIFAWSSSF